MDRLTSLPNLIENAKRIRCPVLFIRGDQEPAENYPAEKFKENCSIPCEIAIIPNCDHFYVGAEEQVAKSVIEWLADFGVMKLSAPRGHFCKKRESCRGGFKTRPAASATLAVASHSRSSDS